MRLQRMNQGLRGITIAAVLLTASLASAWRPDRFCAPQVLGWPTSRPTSGDGNVAGDIGYAQAYRFVFTDGTSSPLAAVQAVKSPSGDTIFMSIEVFSSHFDAGNDIVLAFDNGSGSNPYRILEIQPMDDGGTNLGSHHQQSINYWIQPVGGAINPVSWVAQPGAPTGMTIGVDGGSDVSGVAHWQMELAIPTAQLGLSTTADFGMYLNILAADRTGSTVVEMRWPDGASPAPVISGDIQNLPATSNWGRFALNNTSCTGVFVQSWSGDLYTSIDNANGNNGTDLTYNTSRDNYFHALVRNDGSDSPPVRATFKLAPFGTSDWSHGDQWLPPVSTQPAGTCTASTSACSTGFSCDRVTNPSSPSCRFTTTTDPQNVTGSVGGTATTHFRIGPWRLDASQSAANAGQHHCLLVELDSTQNGTAFRTRSAFQNANFLVASNAESNALIDTKGMPLPQGMNVHKFAYYVVPKLQYAYSDGRHEQVPAGRLTAQLDLTYHAFKHTGQSITIRQRRYQIVEPYPGWTITAQHVMPGEFADGFTARHAKINEIVKRGANPELTAMAGDRNLAMMQVYAAANRALAEDPEQPKVENWTWGSEQLKVVGNTHGLWQTVEVPPDTKLPLKIAITAYGSGGSTGPICCLGNSNKSTTPAAGLLVVVGIWTYRRRRD
jgi:hypothetical protein